MALRLLQERWLPWVLVSFSVCLLLAGSQGCGSSEKSQEELTDLSTVPATFTISMATNESQTPPVTQATASAVFSGEGLTFIKLKNGTVHLVEPDGETVQLTVRENQFGAPWYNADLPGSLELGETYKFRVTLANGEQIENRVRTPHNELAITSPSPNSSISKSQPLSVTWTGTNPGNALIFIGWEAPTVFNIFSAAIVTREDDGATTLEPHELAGLTPGGQYLLTVVRGNIVPANGFKPNQSKLGAFLIHSIPVNVTE